MSGHVGTCPGREPQTSPGGGPTTKPSNQEADTEPLDTAETRAFFLIWEPGPSYKAFPHPLLPRRLPLSPCSPAPGSSARERPPNKGLHQRSIEVALSSRGVSYTQYIILSVVHREKKNMSEYCLPQCLHTVIASLSQSHFAFSWLSQLTGISELLPLNLKNSCS